MAIITPRSIPLFKVFMSQDVVEPLTRLVMSGFITQGPQVELFESKLRDFFRSERLLTLNSATSGLTLALRLLMDPDESTGWPGFDPQHDRVLSPALTCFATNAAILANGCSIKWLDTDPTTANVSIRDLEDKLDKYTKVVCLVHWGGYPVDLDAVERLKELHMARYGYKFRVIEDCAHAFGAEYKGMKLGSHGNICVFSLQAIKHLTCGDGGIIILPNDQLYERGRLLRWYGIDRDKRNYNRKDFRLENDIVEWGYKYHMNDLNATIGLYNLPHMEELLEKNRYNCEYLYENLGGVVGLSLMENESDRRSAAWLFTMRVERKNQFVEKMKSCGIMTSQVHNRNDLNTCVAQFSEPLPNLTELEKELICVPVGWWLSQSDLEWIVECVRGEW